MRDKILEKSNELFLNLGFKSVTMDEIASSLGVSKKTIYKYFTNKTELVDTVTFVGDIITTRLVDVSQHRNFVIGNSNIHIRVFDVLRRELTF